MSEQGTLQIRADLVGSRTLITESHRTAPFYIGNPICDPESSRSELILQSVGPGYLPGDQLSIQLATGPNSSLTVRDQSAIKLFGCPAGSTIAAEISLDVAEGSTLVYMPGEIIPFSGTEYHQRVRINVTGNGRAAIAEVVTPGRVAMGERNQYRMLDLRTTISINSRVIVRERSLLEPARRSPQAIGRNGPFACTGVLYLVGPDWGQNSDSSATETVWLSGGSGQGYSVVRILGQNAQDVIELIYRLANTSPRVTLAPKLELAPTRS